MLITPHTKSYLACPCGNGEWELPDADKVWPVYQWYCDECGVKFNIQRTEEGTFSVTPSLERKRKILSSHFTWPSSRCFSFLIGGGITRRRRKPDPYLGWFAVAGMAFGLLIWLVTSRLLQ